MMIANPEDDPPLAPETPEEESWFATQWEALKDAVGDAADAIETFDQNHGRVITRSLGAAQAAGGVLEAVGGVALAGGALLSSTGVGAAPGLPTILGGMALAVNGADNAFTGVMAALTGEFQHNQISEAAGGVAGLLGASPQTVEATKACTDFASGLAGMGIGPRSGPTTRWNGS